MDMSKDALLAAAAYLKWDGFDASKEKPTRELAAHVCRLAAHASDGFEEWFVNTDFSHKDLHLATWQAATLAATVKAE